MQLPNSTDKKVKLTLNAYYTEEIILQDDKDLIEEANEKFKTKFKGNNKVTFYNYTQNLLSNKFKRID